MFQSFPLNARLYILFTVFFNARAYYPVLAILFTDLGLSLEQFVFLNLIWATSIFLFEVPSGALADTLGRRTLLIASASLMAVEMLCLLVAPQNGGWWLLGLCLVNRVCSGLSEACASGADEALAYDSLPDEGREAAWDQVMAAAMRWRSAGMVIAMILGGLMYNPAWLNQLLPASWQIPTALAHRLPVLLVFVQALVCLWASLKMQEPSRHSQGLYIGGSLSQAFAITLQAARWVISHRVTLVLIVVGVAIDSIVRNFATISSSYFRLIELPAWTYGFLGALLGLAGWFVPSIALKLNTRFSMLTNLTIIAAACLLGLIALVPAWPYWGLVPAMWVMSLMWFLGFTVSRVLHRETNSVQRATVLSVKGMIFNLGYGLFSLGFSALLAETSQQQGANKGFVAALLWQVPWFALVMILLLLWARWRLNRA